MTVYPQIPYNTLQRANCRAGVFLCMTRFIDNRYIARRSVRFLRPRVYLYTTDGAVVCAAGADMVRRRRRITVYSDIDLTGPIFTITGREKFGLTTSYDVVDAESHDTLGSVRRPGLFFHGSFAVAFF